MVSEDWLIALNKEFRAKGIEPRIRPWEALRRYSIEFSVPVDYSSKLTIRIFDWFYALSKFESVYFFDAKFWSISIPIVNGAVELNPFGCLNKMPDNIKKELMSNNDLSNKYMTFWADCIDYGFGFDDLNNTSNLDVYGMLFFQLGHHRLKKASAILSEPSPDSRAIITCRMAVEQFLTSFIALKVRIAENATISMGHNIHERLSKFIEVSGYEHWENIREKLDYFPERGEQCKPHEFSSRQLWDGFSIAQSLGAVIVREYTDRDILGQKKGSNQTPHLTANF